MKKDMFKKIAIIVVCVLFVTAGVIVGIKIYNDKNTMPLTPDGHEKVKNPTIDVSKLKEIIEEENDYAKNVQIIKYFYYENSLIKDSGTGKELQVYGKNNNDVAVEIKAELNFYDELGNIVDYKSDRIDVFPGTEFGLSILAYSSKDYYDYSIKYKISPSKSYYIFLDNIETTHKLGNKSILIDYKNNNEIDVDMLRYTCVLYKNNNVVGVLKTFISAAKVGETSQTTCYNKGEIEFDNYEVILSESYNYTQESEKWN
jgi:hypothetical protein